MLRDRIVAGLRDRSRRGGPKTAAKQNSFLTTGGEVSKRIVVTLFGTTATSSTSRPSSPRRVPPTLQRARTTARTCNHHVALCCAPCSRVLPAPRQLGVGAVAAAEVLDMRWCVTSRFSAAVSVGRVGWLHADVGAGAAALPFRPHERVLFGSWLPGRAARRCRQSQTFSHMSLEEGPRQAANVRACKQCNLSAF